MESSDKFLVETFLKPIRECYKYKPAFGLSSRDNGVSFTDFEEIFGNDPFYSWIGLASPSVYAAHKAAGGLTSVYRQLGIGSERLFRAILNIALEIDEEKILWSYKYNSSPTKLATHTLDACLRIDDLQGSARQRLSDWITGSIDRIGTSNNKKSVLDGVVFEVRQGYKSADSKRQNADLRFGLNAYQSDMLPAFAIFSNQVSYPVIHRYRADGMLVLTGISNEDPFESTFAFFKKVVEYDLSNFFERNKEEIRREVRSVVSSLLVPSD
ncbi:hypothetical protein [Jiella marina]|uniref:hypothetical protein n=1 Tax=Jiella sp. LLJ827 TaxID=2917712 RepID=UPI002101152F|nr:hypothetical protein [Jiella sp. LLJ827]MCQ0990592.1 hypothetical protein [Jiella sp. LLJ827]